ncbi:MAG: hypothetical protein J7639_32630, partial [Paenibacillaceae bacterium]|nr:hypothetical protein [Paenibacillaceae bacterium]
MFFGRESIKGIRMSLKVLSIVMVVLIAGALAKKSVFADTYVVVADRTAMLALDGTVDSVAYLQESDGRGGLFEWNAASISSTLTGADIVSSAVNSGTDTITSASHRLFTGMAVITTTAVNGLATNTIYYVITVDADNFQLATSFANAVAGTKIDLTGTAAVTVKQHFDPLGGFYVTPTSDVTGASGAWARADRFVRRPSITDFGAATTNSAAANDEAFQAAINFNGDVYVPKGVYELSRKAERWGGLTLYGDGPGASVLYWKNANSHGIEIKLSQTLTDFADVQNLDFRTNDTAGTSVAIKLDGSAQLIERPAHLRGNGTRQMAHFDNINIYGLVDPYVSGFDGPSVAGWDGGIWANETINVNLSNIYFNGMYNGATQETDLLSSFGFKVTSSDAGKGSVFKVDNSQVYYAEKAVEFDTVEGVQVQNSVLVAVKYGVFGHVSGTKPGPHFSLVDSHINAQFRAVDIDEQQQIFITDNLIYQRPNIVSNGIGIALSNVKDGIVANNILVRNTTLTNANYEYRGIVLASGTENVQVYDNIGRDTTYVVEAQDGSTGNRVYRNDLRNVSPNGSLTRQLYT